MTVAKWTRMSPAVLAATSPIKGGTMIMAVAAKKHLTVFVRTRHCRTPPGRLEVKNAFKTAARETLGTKDRGDRNVKVQAAIKAAGLKTGVYHRKSRARAGSPLYGQVYTIGGAR